LRKVLNQFFLKFVFVFGERQTPCSVKEYANPSKRIGIVGHKNSFISDFFWGTILSLSHSLSTHTHTHSVYPHHSQLQMYKRSSNGISEIISCRERLGAVALCCKQQVRRTSVHRCAACSLGAPQVFVTERAWTLSKRCFPRTNHQCPPGLFLPSFFHLIYLYLHHLFDALLERVLSSTTPLSPLPKFTFCWSKPTG